ncbi:MAG: DNA cytosine methyltransferase [Bacteroidales bacterium]
MYKVISLFSGAGGMDKGFEGNFSIFDFKAKKTDFKIVQACEIDKFAVKTYNYNFTGEVFNGDVREYKAPYDTDIVLGGFPCQDFSLAGKMRGLKSERGNLYLEMARIISESNPKVFIAENVENLTKIDNGTAMEQIVRDFKELGYAIHYNVYDMSKYGIPQKRKRVIIFGVKQEYDKIIGESITDLSRFETKVRSSFDAIDDLWGTTDLNQQDKYSKAKFRYNSKSQGNVRIARNQPAPTIRAEHHGNIEGHYRTTLSDENDIAGWRRLTPRECARLQTFPDDFIFPVSASSAYKQIGNAVPPMFAWYVAQNVQEALKKIYEYKN